jgi:hypothetical protein
MSLEMAHKVILPPKKNYIPQFLKQRDINSYYLNADSDPGNQTNADPDPGQALKSQKEIRYRYP